jgi:hypothetical protein
MTRSLQAKTPVYCVEAINDVFAERRGRPL